LPLVGADGLKAEQRDDGDVETILPTTTTGIRLASPVRKPATSTIGTLSPGGATRFVAAYVTVARMDEATTNSRLPKNTDSRSASTAIA